MCNMRHSPVSSKTLCSAPQRDKVTSRFGQMINVLSSHLRSRQDSTKAMASQSNAGTPCYAITTFTDSPRTSNSIALIDNLNYLEDSILRFLESTLSTYEECFSVLRVEPVRWKARCPCWLRDLFPGNIYGVGDSSFLDHMSIEFHRDPDN